MTTFWQGHRAEDNAAIVAFCEQNDKREGALGDFLKFAQVYYDIHNNGCFNWNRQGPKYRALCRKYDVNDLPVHAIRSCIRHRLDMNEVETLGNLIMDAALEMIKD